MKHGGGEGRPAHRHWGTTLDAFLAEVGIREAAKPEGLTRAAALVGRQLRLELV